MEAYRELCELKLEQAGYDLPVTEDSQVEQSNTQDIKR